MPTDSRSFRVKILHEYNVALGVINGKLFACPLDSSGFITVSAGMIDWAPLPRPIPQGLLEAANAVFKTQFQEADLPIEVMLLYRPED
jgi:hypothetical protein